MPGNGVPVGDHCSLPKAEAAGGFERSCITKPPALDLAASAVGRPADYRAFLDTAAAADWVRRCFIKPRTSLYVHSWLPVTPRIPQAAQKYLQGRPAASDARCALAARCGRPIASGP